MENLKNVQLDLFEIEEKHLDPEQLPHFDSPVTDDEILLNCQYEMIVNHSAEAKKQMWLKCLVLARKMLGTELSRCSKFIDRDTYEEVAYDACIYYLRRYETDPLYYVRKSVISQIYGGVLYALHYKSSGQKLYENAVHKANELGLDFETALEVARKELDERASKKKGRKCQRLKAEEFEKRQLKLF